ncbi:MAG: hypothetical protein OEY64_09390 [Nitrospinota bacterium]|nr:hypothetical protein [Nitrospinota bacterium]
MNNSNSGNRSQRPGGPPHGKPRGSQGPQGRSRPVSSNYQVDLFHHQIGAKAGQQPSGHTRPSSGGGPRYGQSKGINARPAQGRHQAPRPKGPVGPSKSQRKGYTVHNFELKDELYKNFEEKLKETSKTPKEVINQLISFFNMGKIKI